MSTIARPYAAAAYEFALGSKDLDAWQKMLETAAFIANDARVKKLLNNPSTSVEEMKQLFCDILKPLLNTERKNFIWLLAENERLAVLPEVVKLFNASLSHQKKIISAEVISAIPLDAAYRQTLSQALTKRFKQQVELHYAVDPSLLGGVIVRAGDKVIDGSVRGRLSRLQDFF